jgi:hypothetical protein
MANSCKLCGVETYAFRFDCLYAKEVVQKRWQQQQLAFRFAVQQQWIGTSTMSLGLYFGECQ